MKQNKTKHFKIELLKVRTAPDRSNKEKIIKDSHCDEYTPSCFHT